MLDLKVEQPINPPELSPEEQAAVDKFARLKAARIEEMDYHALARLASNNGDGSELSGDAVQRFGELVAEQARIENREALDCLRRIVSYYDDPRVGSEWRGLPGMSEQAKCQHESTMFGEARALLLRSNAKVTGGPLAARPLERRVSSF